MLRRSVVRQPLEELEFALHRFFINAILAIDIVFASRFYRIIGDFMQPVLLGSAAVIFSFYAVYTLARGRLLPAVAGSLFVCMVLTQIDVFSTRAAVPFNPNVFFQFMWLLAFIPFYAWTLMGELPYLMKRVALFSTAYCAVYLLLSLGHLVGAIPYSLVSPIVSTDSERGSRIFLYLSTASIAYFYWLSKFKYDRSNSSYVLFWISALAITVSLSRVYILIVLCLTVLFYLDIHAKTISRICRITFVVVTAYIISGLVIPSFNPFIAFASDTSGAYRAYEYVVVRREVLNSPIWGFGVPPDTKLTRPFLGEQDIFPSDLGALGTWFDLGLAGFLLYLFVIWRCSKPSFFLQRRHGWPLFLSGCMLTAYGGISPLAMSAPGGATLTALIFGVGAGGALRYGGIKSRRNPKIRDHCEGEV